jgi:hypothetical protein
MKLNGGFRFRVGFLHDLARLELTHIRCAYAVESFVTVTGDCCCKAHWNYVMYTTSKCVSK